MSQQFVAFGSSIAAGPYLQQTRDECIQLIQPKTGEERRANVSACILEKFTEIDKSLYASRQYILTLWPAFVGAIVGFAPDPAFMVYDNVWWASLFAVTSGGLPGLDNSASPPHHVEAHSEQEGRSMCEAWEYTAAMPKLMSKSETMGDQTRGKAYIQLEWISFAISCALWLGFCIYFGQTLEPALDFSFPNQVVKGAVWYYISCSPAVLGALFELAQSRVDLYEPAVDGPEDGEEIALTAIRNGTTSSSTPAPRFEKVKCGSVFGLWLRLAVHQWRRTKYRILVRDASAHPFFLIGRAMVGIGRMTVFALGSVTMGNILLMPVPDDLYLFILLLFATSVPRQLWPAFWANGNRGADLVVFVNSITLINLKSEK